MKNSSKKIWPMFFNLFLLLPLLAPVAPSFSLPTATVEVSCTAPSPTKNAHSSGYISFSWSAVPGATDYRVWYVRHQDSFTSESVLTGGTSCSFSGLPAGNYSFYFQTVCGETASEYVIVDDLMM